MWEIEIERAIERDREEGGGEEKKEKSKRQFIYIYIHKKIIIINIFGRELDLLKSRKRP